MNYNYSFMNSSKKILTTTLLLLLTITTCCFAQSKVQVQQKIKQHKLVKTQGTNEYTAVNCGLQDKAGNLWFGSNGEGMYRCDPSAASKTGPITFTNYTTKDGLGSNTILCILEDKSGNIWISTDSGLYIYDPLTALKKGSAMFTAMPIHMNGSNLYPFIEKSSAGANVAIWSMMQDHTGKIWMGTYNSGVYCYDPGTKTFSRFLQDGQVINKNKLYLGAVRCIMEDRKGNIWFTTWFEGLCRFDGKALTNYKPNNEVWYSRILEDRHGNIWIDRRDKGALRYDPATETFTNVLQHGIFDSCGSSPVLEDKDGNIWFCAEPGNMTLRETQGGIWRYDPKAAAKGANAFTNFTKKDGLTHMTPFCIVQDKTGRIWFGTRNMGLCSYDPQR
ncbi:MAG: hypothetical protein JWQ38_3409 [Flavipsychrobacter sp.]|nr:hypothetical protein [Flavipsychrobacter sp.]